MKEGLMMVQLPGRYGYSVTRVGWARRVNGDEWELLGGRSVVRTSGSRKLPELAADGPKNDHRVDEATKLAEPFHRLLMRRTLYVGEAWVELCPRPKDWDR